MAKVKLSREDIKRIKKERKILRKRLREQGIKSRAEFERIAFEVGLALPEDKLLGFLFPWWRRALYALQAVGAPGYAAALAAILGGMFAFSTVTQERGNFTINLTGDLLDIGFVLSDTEDFADPKVRLSSNILREVNAISIADLPEDIQNYDGSHDGESYVAYTFYIKNAGKVDNGYSYDIVLNSSSLGTQYAVWLMLFDENGQVVYAMPSQDGDPENLYGYQTAPMGMFAKHYGHQYYKEGNYYGVVTTPYNTETEVMHDSVDLLAVDDYKKYTVVIWVEGDDPECTNEILGGHAGFTMEFRAFESSEDQKGIFGGVRGYDDEDIIDEYLGDHEDEEVTTYRPELPMGGQLPVDTGQSNGATRVKRRKLQ